MTKIKTAKIGLTFGIMLAILYTLRTIILMLFPDFVVNVANQVMYRMITINPPLITIYSFVIGIIVVFVGGFVFGFIFSLIYNKIVK